MQRPRKPKKGWWAGLDLNQRIAFASRIYSPVPLTTRPPTHGDPSTANDGTIPRAAGPRKDWAFAQSVTFGLRPSRLRHLSYVADF